MRASPGKEARGERKNKRELGVQACIPDGLARLADGAFMRKNRHRSEAKAEGCLEITPGRRERHGGKLTSISPYRPPAGG